MQCVQGVNSNFSVPPNPPRPPSPPVQLSTAIPVEVKPWNERALTVLDVWDERLDHLLPNSVFQTKIDALGRAIEKRFAFFKTWNDWLDRHDMGSWYYQLAMYLIKLPQKVVRNILNLLYDIFKAILHTAVHPLKAPLKLAKLIVKLAHALTLPETWVKMGVGMCGTCIGQSLVTGNPISLIGIAIGGAMVLGGMTAGTLKFLILLLKGKDLEAEGGEQLMRILKEIPESARFGDHTAATAKSMQLIEEGKNLQARAGEQLIRTLRDIPESTLTGFCFGLIVGGIQRAINVSQTRTYEAQMRDYEARWSYQGLVKRHDQMTEYARLLMKEQSLAPNSNWEYDQWTGKISVEGPSIGKMAGFAGKIRVEVLPKSTTYLHKLTSTTTGKVYWANEYPIYDAIKYPDSLILPNKPLLPPMPNATLDPLRAVAGPAGVLLMTVT